MRIVYLAAGAAGMYCGSCLHDNTLAAAMIEAGEDVLLVPTYTPIRTDEEDVSEPRVMFGGINVYLQQKVPLFRRTPWFLDWLFDRPRLIDWLARRSMSTQAAGLGDLTVSMLRGEEGNQRKEVEKLVHWLASHVRPEVVHLSNSMLVGMAREIRRRLHVPIVCTLSGEDIFLEKLPAPWYEQARAALRERARDVTAFVALNRYYADFMSEYLDVEPERIHVIPHGLKLAGHGTRRRPPARREFVIGFLARICEDKGLHHLADALALLAGDEAAAGGPPVVLKAAGYLGKSDRAYLDGVTARLRGAGLHDRFEYVGELDRAGKIEFLQSLDVMSLPTVYRESKGLPVLEAWANAVPVVLPAHGTFPELIEDTGGGRLHEPENPRALADALKEFIRDERLCETCGRAGQQAVHARYTDHLMARRTLDLYRRLMEKPVPEKAMQS
ncbi:MAG: glycosyltransferase family 4 protein [Planctomycetia bacterium]|nr:glycosyltransferase family 4 protein [Planctomycetia bacterium]